MAWMFKIGGIAGHAGRGSDVIYFLSCGRVVCMECVGPAGRPVLSYPNSATVMVGKCLSHFPFPFVPPPFLFS